MTAKQLIDILLTCKPDAKVIFAEYQGGRTLRWHMNRCCNTEHQDERNEI